MQSAMVLFLIFLLITLFIMAKMIHARTGSYLLTFCLVFSAGTLAAIERGNVILLAFILTFYFVEHYKDENRLTSELALLSLAAAFGFKLYPCIFGLLLIKDRKWAAAGRKLDKTQLWSQTAIRPCSTRCTMESPAKEKLDTRPTGRQSTTPTTSPSLEAASNFHGITVRIAATGT